MADIYYHGTRSSFLPLCTLYSYDQLKFLTISSQAILLKSNVSQHCTARAPTICALLELERRIFSSQGSLYSSNEVAIIITEDLRRAANILLAIRIPNHDLEVKQNRSPSARRSSSYYRSTVPCTPVAPYVHHTAHPYPDATPQHPEFTRIIISLDR